MRCSRGAPPTTSPLGPCLTAKVAAFDARSNDALFAAAYTELKRVAQHHLRVRAPVTLKTTELVHEAYLKLGHGDDTTWDSRAHFFGAASRAMRQVLVDIARQRQAAKRGGAWRAVTLSDGHAALEVQLDEILALDAALDRLNAVEQRLREIVELRFFGGASEQEIAQLLGISERTVRRDWLRARLFLLGELETSQ